MFSLFYHMILLEEGDSPEYLSEHDILLAEIYGAIPGAVSELTANGWYWTTYRMRQGKVWPRDKIQFFWRAKRVRMWRLAGLHHPLWLGEDGVIYRAFDEFGDSYLGAEPEHQWLRAEIEKRDEEGLRRILSELQKLQSSKPA